MYIATPPSSTPPINSSLLTPIINQLVENHGREEMGERIRIRDPSIKSVHNSPPGGAIALHHARLTVIHPVSKAEIIMEAPYPPHWPV